MKNVPLFATNIFHQEIDPSSYQKEKIVNAIVSNYNKNPSRNNWAFKGSTNLHHYYNDWNNKDYDEVDLSSLIPLYHVFFKNVLSEYSFINPVSYKFTIQNITVGHDKNQSMEYHHHLEESDNSSCFFVSVHYLSIGANSQTLDLKNPIPYADYLISSTNHFTRKYLDSKDPAWSYRRPSWHILPKEDEIIFFPSFLHHSVKPSSKEDKKLRICIATNYHLKII